MHMLLCLAFFFKTRVLGIRFMSLHPQSKHCTNQYIHAPNPKCLSVITDVFNNVLMTGNDYKSHE